MSRTSATHGLKFSDPLMLAMNNATRMATNRQTDKCRSKSTDGRVKTLAVTNVAATAGSPPISLDFAPIPDQRVNANTGDS